MSRIFMPMALCACMTAMAYAQGAPAVKPQPGARPAATEDAKQKNIETEFNQHAAACLLIGNQEEIAIAQIGAERARNDRVKDFANMMIKDHQKFVTKLRKFTPQMAEVEFRLKTDDSGDPKALDEKPAREATRRGEATVTKTEKHVSDAAGSVMDRALAVKRDAAQECFAMISEELKSKNGHDFDMAFMGSQCAAHMGMLAQLRALKKHTHGEFAELVAEGEKTTKEHLDHAMSIIEDMKHEGDKPAARTARESRDDRNASDRPAPPPRDERAPPRRERD